LTFEFDFTSVAATIGALNAVDFRLLIDDDGNFANATVLNTPNVTFTVAGSVVKCIVNGLVANWPVGQPYFTLGSVSNTTPLPVQLSSFAGTCINGFTNLKMDHNVRNQ